MKHGKVHVLNNKKLNYIKSIQQNKSNKIKCKIQNKTI